jgi:hypothetical protein
MKNVSAALMVLLISMMIVNVPTDFFTTVSADSGDSFPFQPTDDIIIDALGYLHSQQAVDGSIGGFSVSGWTAMAISAAEEDPHNWGNFVEYLRNNVDRIDDDKATDWERQILAIVACNENPRDFGGIDYVAKVESFYDGNQIDSIANLYDDFFGILALVSSGVDKDSEVVQTVRAYIKEEQNEDGSWGDVDSTGAAVMALISAGEKPDSVYIIDALSFMKTTQTGCGGFQSWGTTNAASTAWAVNAIVAAEEDPTSSEWRNSGNSPIDYLLSLQQEDGSFNWAVDQTMNPEWMTSYVVPALLGTPYPIKIYESEGGDEGNDDVNENDGEDDTDGDDDDGNQDDGDANVDDWIGNIRIEGKNDTIWNSEVCFSDSMINALNDSSGEMEDYHIPYPSVLGALDEAAQQGGFSYFVIYYPSWDAFFVKTIADDSDWWHYWVDYILPMVGAGTYELTDENEEVLWGYLEDWNARALRIIMNKDTVNVSEEFIVSVYNETMSPVEDAFVYIGSSEYITDENGNVTIQVDTSGDYEIYSEKDGYVRSEKVTINVKKSVEIIKPEGNAVYILNRKTLIQYPNILIIGHIDIEVQTTDDVEKVEFYINNELEYVDTEQPFSWRLNGRAFFKKVTIKVKAYTSLDDVIFNIQQIIKYIDSLSENHHAKQVFDTLKTYLQNLEVSALSLSDVDEKEIVIINFFPRIHIL